MVYIRWTLQSNRRLIMNEDQLLKAFEEYKGYELGDFDIATCIQFECYKAGYELFCSDLEYGTKVDLPRLLKIEDIILAVNNWSMTTVHKEDILRFLNK